LEDGNQPATALVPFAVATETSKTGNSKRPVGPVRRLLQEGRSRKNKGRTEVTKSTATNTAMPRNDGASDGTFGGGGITAVSNTNSSLAKKLHAKVKSEKELKMDPKKRVKTWLKGVEVDWTPIPLDAQGFPIYR